MKVGGGEPDPNTKKIFRFGGGIFCCWGHYPYKKQNFKRLIARAFRRKVKIAIRKQAHEE